MGIEGKRSIIDAPLNAQLCSLNPLMKKLCSVDMNRVRFSRSPSRQAICPNYLLSNMH